MARDTSTLREVSENAMEIDGICSHNSEQPQSGRVRYTGRVHVSYMKVKMPAARTGR